MTEEELVTITPLPIVGFTPCCVPVLPGTERVDAPLEERTELCAVDANWIVGMAPTCDPHMKAVCGLCEWNWEELVAEAGRDLEAANAPWGARQRHTQEEAQRCHDHYAKEYDA